MSITHIFTVGASLIINASRAPNIPDNLKNLFSTWIKRVPGTEEDKKTAAEFIGQKNKIVPHLYQLLKGNPRRYSAELNAYLGLVEKYPEFKADRVILYPTATGIGKVASTLLEQYLKDEQKIKEVEIIDVRRFGLGPDYFDEAILETLDKLCSRIKRLKEAGDRVFLNLTGGFKPEVSVALIAAALFEVDLAYYIYEVFNEVVVLPLLPLKVKESTIKQISEAFKGRFVAPISDIPEELFDDLKSRGLILVDEEHDSVKLREWVKKIIST